MNSGEREDDDGHEEAARQSFTTMAGEDGEVDAFELQNILDPVFKRGDCYCASVSRHNPSEAFDRTDRTIRVISHCFQLFATVQCVLIKLVVYHESKNHCILD